MAQIDIDEFVISLMRYFGNNKGIATTLDRCLFSLGLKYVDTPTGGRLERVDQPTMLEKIMWGSGEQKPADKNGPKFHEGDWVVSVVNGNIYHVINAGDSLYLMEHEGERCTFPWRRNDDILRAWNIIQDAKDGDVVVDKSDGAIGIFQSIGHHPDGGSYNDTSYCFLHCHCDDEFFYADFEHGNEIDSDDLVPATKEQCNLLFSKMKEAGYEWDAEKKELKKIEQEPAEWTKEDEEHVNSLLKRLEGLCRKVFATTKFAINEDEDWLKSLRPQNHWKPSEEQMQALDGICSYIRNKADWEISQDMVSDLYKLSEQLKKLREE